jgi:hypothetical protein
MVLKKIEQILEDKNGQRVRVVTFENPYEPFAAANARLLHRKGGIELEAEGWKAV